MSDSSSFSWIGGVSDDWNTAGNWIDLSTDEAPATVVPGSLDTAIVNNGTVTGSGTVASLTFQGTGLVLGDLNTGTVLVEGANASLEISAAGTVSAGVGFDIGTMAVFGAASVLLVEGLLQIGGTTAAGVLSASDGASVDVGDISFGSNLGNQLEVAAASSIEIGDVGTPQAGAVTIDQGHTLAGPGSVTGAIVENGIISSNNLTLGDPLFYSGGHGSSSYSGAKFTGSLSGLGTVEVETDGAISLQEPVTVPGLTFQLDGFSNLDIAASISAGNTILLDGQSNTLTINDEFYLEEHPASLVGQMPYYTGGPPSVEATIIGFNGSDELDFLDDPILGITITAAAFAGNTLMLQDNGSLVSAFNLSGNYLGETISVGTPTGLQQAITVPCFVEGTRILTANGETAVEELREGDFVIVLRANGTCSEKVKWIGNRRVLLTEHPRPDVAAPIRILRDAIGPSLPHRDLLVSPDHCLLINKKLIPALMLVNDMTILQECCRTSVHYFHVELDIHGILLAEGLPMESYLDTGNRLMFSNAGLALLLHPEFHINGSLRTWHDDACAQLAVDPATLEPIWRDLVDRAEQLGFPRKETITSTDPCLRIVTSERTIAPVYCGADHQIFIVPAGTSKVILSSLATRPADIVRYLDDRRSLGVAISEVTLRLGQEFQVFPADHLPSGSGWHAHESTTHASWRWTDGAGELLFDPIPEVGVMEIRLCGRTRYVVDANAIGIAA